MDILVMVRNNKVGVDVGVLDALLVKEVVVAVVEVAVLVAVKHSVFKACKLV
ncbi:hypothetical protein BDAP_000489 [Binucleata daphniae]